MKASDIDNKDEQDDVPYTYSKRLKLRDLRRWNQAQTIMIERLGIEDNIEAVFKLSKIFATLTDLKARPARFSEIRMLMGC